MTGLEDLVEAVEHASWAQALTFALDLWRDTRACELAELIDAITARLPATAPTSPLHAWWLERAARYDPMAIGDLVRVFFDEGMLRGSGNPDRMGTLPIAQLPSHGSLAERLVALSRWPADPRAMAPLVTWLATTPLRVRFLYFGNDWPVDNAAIANHRHPIADVYMLIGDVLGMIGDRRALPALRGLAAEPPAAGRVTRVLQRDAAVRAIAEIETRALWPASPPALAQLASCLARVGPVPRPEPPVPPSVAPVSEELWDEIAANPDEDAPRLVLADALIEHGDPRGTLIALQVGERHQHARGQINRLIDAHWARWLGDLTRLVLRRGSEFRRGMLEIIRIGPGSTPPWVYDKALGHRELLAVRTVRPHRVRPADYGRFIAGLPAVRAVGFDSVALVHAVRDAGVADRIAVAEFSHSGAPIIPVIEALAECLPLVEELRFLTAPASTELVASLHARFSRLRAIAIEVPPDDPHARARLSEIAGVRFGRS